MTTQQIALVQSSWQQIKQVNPVLIGDVFYTRLFSDLPQVKHLFQTSKIEQSKKLLATLATIVNKLDRFDDLSADIQKLAIRHVHYGVQAKHYDAVGVALLWTLETTLDNDWTKELEQAWTRCYNLLAHTMINAANASQHDEAVST
jgi:hemoglobin-like flavoprotein